MPSDTTLNKYRESGSVACELAANIQMSRAKTLHVGIDATSVGTPKGNMDTINVWVAVGPTTTNGLVRPAEVITPAIFRLQGDGTANGEANGVEIILQEGQ